MKEELVNTLKLLHYQMAQHIEAYHLAHIENADASIIRSMRSQIAFLREEIDRLESVLLEESAH
jgi:hypothetical protein